MFTRFERKVAFRYLRAKRRDSFISLISLFSFLGIMLGVATLIVVMSVMNGFRRDLEERMLGMQGHINIFPYRKPIEENYNIDLEKYNEIAHIIPFVEGQVMAISGRDALGAVVKGWSNESLTNKPLISESIDQSVLERFKNEEGVIIGSGLAFKLRLQPGDSITLVSPAGRNTVMGFMPRMKAYPIIGTFKIGMYEYDSSTIIMPIKDAQIYFQLKDRLSGIELLLNDFHNAGKTARKLENDIGDDYRILSWEQSNVQFFNALKVEKNVMFFILTLIIAIAALNVVSSMIMLVKDKAGDIAVLRTIGATRASIMKIFFICGAAIGTLGTICGFGLGLAFATNINTIKNWLEGLTGMEIFVEEIYFLSTLPSHVKYEDVIWVVTMSLALSFLATIYPSLRASRVNPAEALKYE